MIVSSWCFIVNQISLFLLRTINFLESPTHTYISPPIISCVAANALFNIPIKVRIRTSFLAAAQLEYRPSTSQINSGALGFFCYKTAVKVSLEFMLRMTSLPASGLMAIAYFIFEGFGVAPSTLIVLLIIVFCVKL